MTTRTERIQRVTYEHSHAADLAAAHTKAREQWQAAAAETAGELRAFADFLHELDVPGLKVLADDLIGERMAETQEWVVPKFPDAVEPTAVVPEPDGPLLEWLNQGPADDENRPGKQVSGWIPRRPDVILGELVAERTAAKPVLAFDEVVPEPRDWSQEWRAFAADVREMWRDARQGLRQWWADKQAQRDERMGVEQ